MSSIEAELDEKDDFCKYKTAINQTVGIGNLKNDLILIILETDPAKKKALFQALDVPEHAYFADPVV